jgi:CheY-like chemotaxis protein
LGDEHKLFVLGLCAPPEPYSLEETKGGRYTGLRLIRDLRANPTSKDTPIIISTACSDMARDTLGLLEDEGIPTLSMPWERDDFMDALERVMPEIAALSH